MGVRVVYDPKTLELALTVVWGVWDRGLALLKSGKSSREKEFSQIVEPLYRELQPIASDYFGLFVGAYQDIEQVRGKSFAKPLANLKKRRETLRSARMQIRSRSKKLVGLCKDEALLDFLSSVVSFIESGQTVKTAPVTSQNDTPPKGSRSAALVKELEILASKNISKDELLARIGAAIQEMEQAWASVGAAYARVQARYLGLRSLQ
jgi:hypothetical protein